MFLMFLMLLMSTSWCDAYNHDNLDRDGVTGGHGTSQREVLKGIWAWSSSLEAFTFSSAIQSCISMYFLSPTYDGPGQHLLWLCRVSGFQQAWDPWFLNHGMHLLHPLVDASGNLVGAQRVTQCLISWKSPSFHVISFPFSFEVTLKTRSLWDNFLPGDRYQYVENISTIAPWRWPWALEVCHVYHFKGPWRRPQIPQIHQMINHLTRFCYCQYMRKHNFVEWQMMHFRS